MKKIESGSYPIFVILLLLGVIYPVQLFGQTVLIDSGAEWKYLDDGSDQGSSWYAIDFDDNAWPSGTAHFGYGDGDEATVINFGPDTSNPYATTYFRHSFEIADTSQHVSLILELLRDDAAIVYLNGNELLRSNLSATHIINYATLARNPIEGAEEDEFLKTSHYPSNIVEGKNVLAVEVHQSREEAIMPDLSFDLRLTSTDKRGVSTIEDLDSISHFRFAIMSDNKGDSPYVGNWGNDKEKSRLSMERLAAWTRSSYFILGLGDHLVRSDGSDPFLDFIQNDPYWRVNFYPNVADGENQAFGTGQDDWGAGKEIFNYVDDFWGRNNVVGQGNGVDYYAFFKKGGFTVHVISLHYSDSGPGLIEESRQFMEDKLTELAKIKTDKDIILVLAHSTGGDFVKNANFTSARKHLLLSTADLCVSATIHTFERYPDYNIQYPNGAVHYNSGAASQTGSTHGYMEMHVLDDPPRIAIQYINLEDNDTRQLQTGYIEGIGDPTLATVKEINGPAYEVDWNLFQGTPVGINYRDKPATDFILDQNYPNPFNPTTIIGYNLSALSDVTLSVYNIQGRLIKILVQSRQPAGNYEVQWDARNERGVKQASGVYFYQLQARSRGDIFVITRKMLLTK